MGRALTWVVAVVLFLGVMVGISAGFGEVTMLLWNAVARGTHHADAQVSFSTAWAGYVLLSVVGSVFRSVLSHEKKS